MITSCQGRCEEPPSSGWKNLASSCWKCHWQIPLHQQPVLELVQLLRAAFPTITTPSQSSCHSVTFQNSGKRPSLQLGTILGFQVPYGVS